MPDDAIIASIEQNAAAVATATGRWPNLIAGPITETFSQPLRTRLEALGYKLRAGVFDGE